MTSQSSGAASDNAPRRSDQITTGDLIALAQRIAESAHANQLDKAAMPYVDHPRRVAARLASAGAPAEAVAAGWLHDVLEDTDVSADQLREAGIPAESIAAVEAVSKRAGESTQAYASRIVSVPLAREVKLADLADNSDPTRLALLDAATRTRLQAKYDQMRSLLAPPSAAVTSHGATP